MKIGQFALVAKLGISIGLGARRNQESPVSSDKETFHSESKRTQLEMILEMLKVCTEPTKKTHLIFMAKLNHYQLLGYVEMLQKFGMIEAISKPIKGFVITEKGRKLLRLFDYS
ncbi:MAG: winged helix-turn-helix domain-containing protein [Nitrososphaerales archaeon]